MAESREARLIKGRKYKLQNYWKRLQELVQEHSDLLEDALYDWLRKDLFKEVANKQFEFETALDKHPTGTPTLRELQDLKDAIKSDYHGAMRRFIQAIEHREVEMELLIKKIEQECFVAD